jgi:hypothetical protein
MSSCVVGRRRIDSRCETQEVETGNGKIQEPWLASSWHLESVCVVRPWLWAKKLGKLQKVEQAWWKMMKQMKNILIITNMKQMRVKWPKTICSQSLTYKFSADQMVTSSLRSLSEPLGWDEHCISALGGSRSCRSSGVGKQIAMLCLLYWCFTGALLMLYWCFTDAS